MVVLGGGVVSNMCMGISAHGLTLTLPQAAVVMDLFAAGVAVEVGEVPFAWLGGQVVAKPVEVVQVLPVSKPIELKPSPTMAKPTMPVMKMGQPAPSPAVVWTVGDGGGLVVAVRGLPRAEGSVPLSVAEQGLLDKMVVAVGAGPVTGWVVVGSREDTLRMELHGAMVAAAKGLKPTRMLVLGEAALGTLAGQVSRVESWQNVGVLEGFGAVGATFPPSVLLAQPMLKRRAWHHLLAWQQRWERA